MSKTKKLLIALMLLIAVLLIPNMVNATNEQPTVNTETYGANKSIKVTLNEIVLDDNTNEYKFGVSKVKATEPTEWLDLQNIEANTCTAIITPENETHRSILRSTDKCYIFIKDVTNNAIIIKTEVNLSLPKESALNITLAANRDFNISYLYRNASNIGSYYITAVKIDDREIIQKYLEAKNNNENTLNAVKNMLPTDISSNNSWKEMTTPGTYDYAYYYNGELTKNQGLYMIWGQVSYSEGRNIYGYVLYDNYPDDYVLPEEGKQPAPKIEKISASTSNYSGETLGTYNYIATVGTSYDEVKITVKFDQDIVVNEKPTLKIKFGTGNEISVTTGTVSANSITYKYTVTEADKGVLQVLGLSGGNVTNNEGTAAVLTLPEFTSKVVAVEATATPEDTKKYISFPFMLYFGTTTIDLKQGVYDGEYTMYYQFVEVTNENEKTEYDDTKWVKMEDRKPEAPSFEYTGEKKFDLWIKLVMNDKTVYESYRYKFNGSTQYQMLM